MKWIILFFGIVANASASILVKLALTPPRRFPSLSDPTAGLTNGPLWLGLLLYGTAFILYATALARLPLNVAHPVMTTGAVALVTVCSVLVFHEPFYWTRGVGLLLVALGVAFISVRVA